jgi:mannose-1-phosphate guanylyltransferase
MIIPVILAGGSGSRLWPLSRNLQPKQFINLINETTLFQDTILRLPKDSIDPVIICNEEHRFLAAEQLRQISKSSQGIIIEPEGRNTAPAITLAALKLINDFKDPVLLVLPADHLIKDIRAFYKSIKFAKTLTENNKLVTFGITPNKAETGYGYIQADIVDNAKYFNVRSFTEKPNQKNANKYLKSGSFFWNSGMFMFKASKYLKEIQKFEPRILSCCKKSIENVNHDLDFIRLKSNEFLKCPDKSIDYAVMEKTKDSLVIPLDANWSDIGSWDSLMKSKSKDQNGNVLEGDVITDNVKGTYAFSTSRLVSIVGVSDLIIVDTKDALLVTNKNDSQNIKNIVNKLKINNRSETEHHRKVFRPWGYYDSIDVGNGFQAKRISVKPGAKLSLQKHRHRAEHWVVVNGIAIIRCGEKTFKLKKNQSTYIPKGEIHRLENQESTDLEIIEIQTGEYLGEDDIIRLEDEYERN